MTSKCQYLYDQLQKSASRLKAHISMNGLKICRSLIPRLFNSEGCGIQCLCMCLYTLHAVIHMTISMGGVDHQVCLLSRMCRAG